MGGWSIIVIQARVSHVCFIVGSVDVIGTRRQDRRVRMRGRGRRRPAILRLPKMDGATRDVPSGCAAKGIDEEEAEDDEDEDDPVSMVSFACADCATIWAPPDEDDDEEEADGAGID